jgi:hypothetical protein
MKLNLKTVAVFGIAALAALSCTETPTFEKADKGPDMQISSYTESTYMGAQVSVNVNLTDDAFALSTIKAYLYYGETEVANTTVRTKEEGNYTVSLRAPLMTDVSDGVAQLKLVSQNVGLGITEQTLDVALQRPNFDEMYLQAEDGTVYTLKKTEDYCYALKSNFPSYVNGVIVSPAFGDTQEVITLGWDGSALSSEKTDLIPFGASIPGTYTVSVNLLTLKASPTDGTTDEAISSCVNLTKGQTMDFGNIVNVESWNFDPDFFTVDTEAKKVTFNAVDGLYKMDYDSENQWIKVEPMKDESSTQTLSEDGAGAVWVIGSGFGKPTIGPSWNTTNGAYAMAQVSDKVYQFTLAAPSQLSLSGSEIKFFGQKGWGTEFKKANYADIKLEPAFTMTDSGNIKVADVAAGTGYQITLDLTGGINAAKVSYKEVEVSESGLDITINGVKATKMSSTVYKVMAAKVEQGSIITYSGIDNPLAWTFDRDNFTLTNEGLKFNSITGYYSFELNIKDQYVVVRHVKEDGKCATYADEGAITFMGWGVGFPMMANQYGFENGLLTTIAQIEKGVYQFTGVAVADENDTTMVGNCWRTDYLSFKFFGQAGWGVEYNTVTLTDEAAKYLKQDGNMALADGVTLEAGATYRMTVTNCTALDANSKFDCTIDFRKLD